jgi:hypothetical protein
MKNTNQLTDIFQFPLTGSHESYVFTDLYSSVLKFSITNRDILNLVNNDSVLQELFGVYSNKLIDLKLYDNQDKSLIKILYLVLKFFRNHAHVKFSNQTREFIRKFLFNCNFVKDCFGKIWLHVFDHEVIDPIIFKQKFSKCFNIIINNKKYFKKYFSDFSIIHLKIIRDYLNGKSLDYLVQKFSEPDVFHVLNVNASTNIIANEIRQVIFNKCCDLLKPTLIKISEIEYEKSSELNHLDSNAFNQYYQGQISFTKFLQKDPEKDEIFEKYNHIITQVLKSFNEKINDLTENIEIAEMYEFN